MSLSFLYSIFRSLSTRRPLLLYAASWTVLLTTSVAVATFSAEIAFISAVSPSSSCNAADGLIRIPLDVSREIICFPTHMVRRSGLDFFVPIVAEALVVAASAGMVRALGLWEDESNPFAPRV